MSADLLQFHFRLIADFIDNAAAIEFHKIESERESLGRLQRAYHLNMYLRLMKEAAKCGPDIKRSLEKLRAAVPALNPVFEKH